MKQSVIDTFRKYETAEYCVDCDMFVDVIKPHVEKGHLVLTRADRVLKYVKIAEKYHNMLRKLLKRTLVMCIISFIVGFLLVYIL